MRETEDITFDTNININNNICTKLKISRFYQSPNYVLHKFIAH